jgi:hypothetical protein
VVLAAWCWRRIVIVLNTSASAAGWMVAALQLPLRGCGHVQRANVAAATLPDRL